MYAASVAVVGSCCLVFSARPLTAGTLDWLLAIMCLLAGTTLWAVATDGEPRGGFYGGLIARHVRSRKIAWAIRALVVLTAPLGGAGVLAYAAASLADTISSTDSAPVLDWRRAAGSGMLGLVVVLVAIGTGFEVSPLIYLWSVLLISAGLAQFWSAAGARGGPGDVELGDHSSVRSLLGVILAAGGAVVFLNHILHLRDGRHIVTATIVAVGVIAFVVGPWWFRSRSMLERERISRALAVERAELADQLHDSVMQTLALIQRSADDPRAVATLAHRQERDLRDWLLGRNRQPRATTLEAGLRALVADTEDTFGARFEIVTVGDAQLDERCEATLAATREALINATRHAPGAPVSVFLRADAGQVQIFVHDRGPGFDPAGVGQDRHGISDSIIARMQRHGGHAEIRSSPGNGCEVILTLPRE